MKKVKHIGLIITAILGVLTIKYKLYSLFAIYVILYDIYQAVIFVHERKRISQMPSDNNEMRLKSRLNNLIAILLLTIMMLITLYWMKSNMING